MHFTFEKNLRRIDGTKKKKLDSGAQLVRNLSQVWTQGSILVKKKQSLLIQPSWP